MANITIKLENDSKKTVLVFKAFVTSLTDSFKSNPTTIDSNLNPLPGQFMGLGGNAPTRDTNIAFDVLSENINESINNLYKVSLLSNYALGAKVETENANSSYMSNTPPLLPKIKIKFYNILADITTQDKYMEGMINGYEFKPELEAGFYENGSFIYPKLIKVNLNLVLVNNSTDFRGKAGWPYIVGAKPNAGTGGGGQAGQNGKTETPKPTKAGAAKEESKDTAAGATGATGTTNTGAPGGANAGSANSGPAPEADEFPNLQ